ATADARAEPKLANVITPIAGIIDNIGPILAPLLRSRLAAAKTAGVRTYETGGRDLLAHSPGENSIIGYGTQLAREILNPGSLQRDREMWRGPNFEISLLSATYHAQAEDGAENQRALAAKIAQVKESLQYQSKAESNENQRALAAKIAQVKESLQYQSKAESNTNTVPLHEILLPASHTLPSMALKPNYPQAFTRVASVPLAEQAAQAAKNVQLPAFVQQSTLPPYFVAPPPGYKGPLPPPPPPPPLPGRLLGEEPRRSPISKTPILPPVEVDSSSPTTANTPYFPPVIQAETLPPVIIESFTTQSPRALPHATTKQPAAHASDATGYERGRSEVKSAFFEDSGLMVQEAPSTPNRPPSSLGPPFGGGGFGGGRRPTESFEQAASATGDNLSFFSANRKKRMRKH
ncbi:hypothetical protein ANCDUO_05931, partial [Ancylostoma duodenale]